MEPMNREKRNSEEVKERGKLARDLLVKFCTPFVPRFVFVSIRHCVHSFPPPVVSPSLPFIIVSQWFKDFSNFSDSIFYLKFYERFIWSARIKKIFFRSNVVSSRYSLLTAIQIFLEEYVVTRVFKHENRVISCCSEKFPLPLPVGRVRSLKARAFLATRILVKRISRL